MQNIMSNGEHTSWLAIELKNVLDNKVKFNRYGIENPILRGYFILNQNDSIAFDIKFKKNEWLRIQIEEDLYDKGAVVGAMNVLINAISKIVCDGKSLGKPLAIYEVDNILTSEYAYGKEKESIIEALKDGSIFDDGGTIKNLTFTEEIESNIKLIKKQAK